MASSNVVKHSRTKSEIIAISSDGSFVDLYTCPANAKSHMNLLFITNAGANASDIAVQWYRAADTTSYFIIGGKNLSTGEFIQFDGGAFIVLDAGDIIKIQTSDTGGAGVPNVDCFCTVEEFFLPQQSGAR